ncbi:hypothetical protein PU634_04865 [Oceanimonas pelagia]|uniref:Uncharacterized protein n=1 Tax=Oceanimonas pelagia TaxID=3028314 RepID=A0AA50KQ72_9GAMM|nr:hypothetical protein [Oceanimonas pelagia]WMC11698.1 hypothetical protein PU634_04865 [Oceanimonas pelagia]
MYKSSFEKEREQAEDAAKAIRIGRATVPFGYIKQEKAKGWLLPGGRHTFIRGEAVKAAISINRKLNEPSSKKIITRRKSK